MTNIVLDAFASLSKNINKLRGKDSTETGEGVISEKFPDLNLEMGAEDIVKLTSKWEKKWMESDVYAIWKKRSEENEKYWMGIQHEKAKGDDSRAMVDNLIFESLETYLPQVTRRNPEPMVQVKNLVGMEPAPEELKYATDLQKTLDEYADELCLRLKLKKAARHWAIYLLGVAKVGWDLNRDIPTKKIIRPQKLILDPDATIDEDGYTGEFIGERRKLQAGILIDMIKNIGGEKDAEKTIKDLVKDDTGTLIGFVEWWTNEYMCWTIGDHLLMKIKNPHWNYEKNVPAPADEVTGETPLDENGKPMTVPQEAFNHFNVPRKPFIFLSVFNLGKQPIDETSLIGQNLSNQDLINKRNKQIDKNADSMNGGMVVSGERSGLTQQQASKVTEALLKGGTIFIPSGSPSDAIHRMSAPDLPATVYNQVVDTRNRLRDIFGTRGSSPAGLETETTVRGKIMNRTLDTDRIGGGFSEYLEQFADEVYNWFVQLLYVYDEKYAGQQHPVVIIGVKEGSLLPKDSTTLANQAIELAAQGKMSLIDLYKKLDYPNPEELAANVWLEVNAPEIMFANDPRVQQVMQQRQAAAGGAEKPPSESISFKDLPPDGQAQMAAQAGIQLNPAELAAKEAEDKAAEANRPVMPAMVDGQ